MKLSTALLFAAIVVAGLFFAVMRPPESRFGDVLEPEELSRMLAGAAPRSVPVLIYVHADWCADCPDFESRMREPDLEKSFQRFAKYHYNATSAAAWPPLAALGIESVPALIAIEYADGRAQAPVRRVLAAYSRIPVSALKSFLETKP